MKYTLALAATMVATVTAACDDNAQASCLISMQDTCGPIGEFDLTTCTCECADMFFSCYDTNGCVIDDFSIDVCVAAVGNRCASDDDFTSCQAHSAAFDDGSYTPPSDDGDDDESACDDDYGDCITDTVSSACASEILNAYQSETPISCSCATELFDCMKDEASNECLKESAKEGSSDCKDSVEDGCDACDDFYDYAEEQTESASSLAASAVAAVVVVAAMAM